MKTSLIRRSLVISAALVAMVAAAACSGGGGKSEVTNAKLEGSWQYASGSFLPGSASTLGTIAYLDFARPGNGSIFTHSATSGFLGCGDLIFAVLNDTVVTIQIPAIQQGVGFADSTVYLTYALSGNTLTLSDAEGNAAVFTKVDSIPDTAKCSVPTTASITTSAPPGDRGGIASDGSKLYWTNAAEDHWVVFDPGTSAINSFVIPIGVGQGRYIQASQATNDWWVDCFCGANQSVERLGTAGTIVDTVDTEDATLNVPLFIRSATFSGSALWLAGSGFGVNPSSSAQILKINSAVEPDALLDTMLLDVAPDAIAFRGSRLFVIVRFMGEELVELDPVGGTALSAYKLPGFRYAGMAAVGNTLYTVDTDDGSLLSIDVP